MGRSWVVMEKANLLPAYLSVYPKIDSFADVKARELENLCNSVVELSNGAKLCRKEPR